jgi:arylsulfatase
MNSTIRFALNGLALSMALVGTVQAQTKLDRTTLPIPERNYPHSTILDARDATPPPRFQITAPEGAPNVIIVLIDDMGFGMSSSFGGPIHMPTAESLAAQGLRYTQFPWLECIPPLGR